MKMTGYDREDIRGKTPRILQGKHSDRVLLRSLGKEMALLTVIEMVKQSCQRYAAVLAA